MSASTACFEARNSWDFSSSSRESRCCYSKKRSTINFQGAVRIANSTVRDSGILTQTGGFAPHIDAVAYTHIKDVKHLTILLAVDESNMQNGGLEVVDGSQDMDIPIDENDHCISSDWVQAKQWTPVELKAGK
jgi:hypothetical protein